jgi:beta-lactam-binding protein with PASTA domain
VTLGRYVGKTFDEAAADVARRGMIAAERATSVAPDDPSVNRVTGQSPPAGSPVRPGEVVTLSVNRAG